MENFMENIIYEKHPHQPFMYRVTHKEWDYKDDLKRIWNANSKAKLNLQPWTQPFIMSYLMISGDISSKTNLEQISPGFSIESTKNLF